MKSSLTYSIIDNYFDWTASIENKKFLLSKKISVDFDTGSESLPLYAAEGKSSVGIIRVLRTFLEGESFSILQINDLSVYALSWESPEGVIEVAYDKKWVPISPLLQSKFLAGVELFKENIIDWHILKDFDSLYRDLVSYINHRE